jgi:hypothetical protein
MYYNWIITPREVSSILPIVCFSVTSVLCLLHEMGGGIASRLMQRVDCADGIFTEADVKKILGERFNQQQFDSLKSRDGTLIAHLISKMWLPSPGNGTTSDTYKVNYIQHPDKGYDLMLNLQLQLWCEAFWHTKDYGSKVWGGTATAFTMCKTMFGSWPRGSGPGQLMLQPIHDEVPVEHRGVKKEWLDAVWKWNEQYMWWTPPTRVWIECFVKPVTLHYGCALYDLVPVQYRKAPDCYLSHSWDLALSCIFKVAASEDWHATSYWIDGFAINQHRYSSDIGIIGNIVSSIRNTVVILRGEGEAAENLRCMNRSWCIYEMVHTPDGCLKCAITAQNGDHKQYAKAIREIDLFQASAPYPQDKEVIDQLVLNRFGDFSAANKWMQKTILKGYRDFFAHGNGFGEVGSAQAILEGKKFGETYYYDDDDDDDEVGSDRNFDNLGISLFILTGIMLMSYIMYKQDRFVKR